MTPGEAIFAQWSAREEFPPARQPNTMADIAARIADEHRIKVSELRGPSRRRLHTAPRQQAMWELVRAGKSLTQIGRFLGGRDHTTVMHGARAHERRLAMAEAAE